MIKGYLIGRPMQTLLVGTLFR